MTAQETIMQYVASTVGAVVPNVQLYQTFVPNEFPVAFVTMEDTNADPDRVTTLDIIIADLRGVSAAANYAKKILAALIAGAAALSEIHGYIKYERGTIEQRPGNDGIETYYLLTVSIKYTPTDIL